MLGLTVLGSCGTFPAAGRACSGYLVQAGDDPADPAVDGAAPAGRTSLWVDTGSGTLGNLLRHATLDELDGIWVSHLHADHCVDLPAAYYALKYGPSRRTRPLPVFGPRGWAEHVERFLSVGDATRSVRDLLDVRELADGDEARVGGLALTAVATQHSVETYGLRAATADGATLAYSADSGPCAALDALADGAGLFLCEAAWDAQPDEPRAIHCTPEDAGETAARAGARRLVVTHVRPGTDPATVAARAAAAYGAPAPVAAEGDTFTVPPTTPVATTPPPPTTAPRSLP